MYTSSQEQIPKANWNCFLIKYLIKSFPSPAPPARDSSSARYTWPVPVIVNL